MIFFSCLDWGYCFFRKNTRERAFFFFKLEEILFAYGNDSLEKGRFNDVGVQTIVRVMPLRRQEEIGFRTQGERLALDENKDGLFIDKRKAESLGAQMMHLRESIRWEKVMHIFF